MVCDTTPLMTAVYHRHVFGDDFWVEVTERKLAERAGQMAALADRFGAAAADGRVRWIDLSPHQARLVESPLDIREALSEQMAAGGKAWIFTSATLGDDEDLSWFTASTGLEDAAKLRVEARAPDGLVEAFSVESAPGFNLCVQWHPEWLEEEGLGDDDQVTGRES